MCVTSYEAVKITAFSEIGLCSTVQYRRENETPILHSHKT